jgi:peroxiredoxin Q/BCP
MLQVGDQAPQFTAQTHTGKKIKLSDFAGKPVILWFYPEADTGG